MIEHNLGVSTEHTFALKRLDTDFFDEDQLSLGPEFCLDYEFLVKVKHQ